MKLPGLLSKPHRRQNEAGSTRPTAPLSNNALINLRQVVKTYETPAGSFTALKGIDLQVNAGEFVAVIGKSGSGKSTLINMITGIDRPTLGEVFVGGTPIHKLNEDQIALWRGRNLGVIFQFFQLLPTLTLLENVMLPMELSHLYSRPEREEWAMHLLEQVDLVDQAHKFPTTLSGGQQQRGAIARALANSPAVLIADEPTGSLDSKTSDTIFELFENFAGQGKTVLMVTHDRDLAGRVSRVVFIADGEITDQQIAAALPSLSKKDLAEVSAKLEPVKYNPGATIVQQGDPAEHVYIIIKGNVDVIFQHASGQEVTIGHLSSGQYFGEMGLLEGGKRTASVRAAADTEVVAMQLDRDTLTDLMARSQMTKEQIIHLMRERATGQRLAEALPVLSQAELDEIMAKAKPTTFAPGDTIVHQGDTATEFYIITAGRVEVIEHRPDEQAVVITRLEAGQHFGELGLLRGGKRMNTVRAAADTEVEVVALDQATFRYLVQENKMVKAEIAHVITRRQVQAKLKDFMPDLKRRKRQIPFGNEEETAND
ncbi:MAG: cyclic nucleotide-binding domain-containing protein [Anaerolineae bacterium]|nr:cyclic nucleotide-binding domain-containing protein [Anaerolineae bacterium]